MKKVMILGAGVYQVPLIKKAHEMGVYTIVVSIPGDYPGFVYADKVYYENIVDAKALVKIAKEEQIDGIVTSGSDVGVISVGTICDELNLKGVSKKAAEITCNKIKTKEVLSSKGVACSKYEVASLDEDIESVLERCNRIGFPVVIKAIDSSGSRGITIVESIDKVSNAIEAVRSVTRSREYLIEEFLTGKELGADAFVYDGEVRFVIPHGKYVYFANTGIPVGHYAPYEDEDVVKKSQKLVADAIKAIGIDNCAVNADIMLHNGEPYILEIGARVGATCIPELISLYNGYDFYEKLIQASLGMDVDVTPDLSMRRASSSRLLFYPEGGTVSIKNDAVKLVNPSSSKAGIMAFNIDKKFGEKVNPFTTGPDRFGHIVAFSDTVKEAEEILHGKLNELGIK